MRYLIILTITCFAFGASIGMAADKRTAQQKPWTDEYQYGAKEKVPEKGDPSKEGEFEVAPKE